MAELSCCNRDHMASKALKYLLSGPFRKCADLAGEYNSEKDLHSDVYPGGARAVDPIETSWAKGVLL